MKLDLKGMSAEQINKAVSAFFSKLTDQMAEDLFGDIIKQYQKVGEGLYETAVRIVMEKEIFLAVLGMTGKAFNGTAQEAIALSQAIIALAGGLEELIEAAENYYDAFFSDAEKFEMLQSNLDKAFADLGLTLPTTRQGFRDLLEGIDLSTEAGQKLYVALLRLAGASGQYYDAVEEGIAAIIDAQRKLLGTTTQGTIDDIRKRYGIGPGVIDADYVRNVIRKFTSISAEEIEAWAKALGVSSAQLIKDMLALAGAFGIVSMNIQDAAEHIKQIFQDVNDFIAGTGLAEKASRMWDFLLDLAAPFLRPLPEKSLIPTPADLANMSDRLTEWFYAAEAAARELGQAELEAARLLIQVADRISGLIDQIDQTIRSIKYSALNVSLPYQKAEAAQEDYNKLLSAALTGGPEDVNKYLSFASTYLQQQQADLKSSQAYQDVYAAVMADMETIKGIAETGGYDAKILEELQKGNQLTVEQTEAYKAAMIEVTRKWEESSAWIAGWVGKWEGAALAISIDWKNWHGDMADALKMLRDLVAVYGWDHKYTLEFLAKVPLDIFKDFGEVMHAAGWVADQSGGWSSKATIAFLMNIAENWKFDNIDQILAAIGWVKTKAGSWTADATIAFIATLMGRYGVPIEDIDYWLRQMGITDTEILREVKIRLIYTMWSSGDLSLPEIAKYAFNQAMAAWLSNDATVAIPILKLLEGLASMWGVKNAYDLGYEVNRHYPAAADAEYWDDLWYFYNRSPSWAKGGIVDQPTLGWVGEAGYPEAVIPMMDGYSIPVSWVNGGSPQSDQPIDLNLTIELDGKIMETRTIRISRREADGVIRERVKAGKLNSSSRYYR